MPAKFEILSGEKLSRRITAVTAGLGKMEIELHTVTCQALALVTRDGRANWLNELFSQLSQNNRDALRAWFNKSYGVFVGKPFLSYSEKKGFQIVTGTIDDRPSLEWIATLAGDMSRSFTAMRSIRLPTPAVGWDEGLKRRFEALAKYITSFNEAAQEQIDKHAPGSENLRTIPDSIIKAVDADLKLLDQQVSIAKKNNLVLVVDNTRAGLTDMGKAGDAQPAVEAPTVKRAARKVKAA